MDMVIEVKDLCHSYRMGSSELKIINNLDFSLEQGKWCCVYGASGSGKTTLLNLLGTLEKPTSGSILVNGVDVAQLSRRAAAAFRGKNIGFIFQSYHLIPELTVLENAAFSGNFAGFSSSQSIKKAKELLERVGLQDRMHHLPSELSGGERQRCAIARSLVNSPKLILADEPTGNLDGETGNSILQLFCELRKEYQDISIVMITHNPDIAQLADLSVKLENGRLA